MTARRQGNALRHSSIIELIKAAGGTPVLAHPKLVGDDELVEQYGQPIEGTEDFGTATSRKLFVSCPMKGRSEEVVYREFDRLCRVAEAYFDETFDIIESFFEEEPPEGITGDKAAVWYLGKSISKISEADVAIFAEGWYDARGCRVEHDVCRSYGIPVIEVELHKARRLEPVECES